MKKYGLFYNGKLIKTYQTKKSVMQRFNLLKWIAEETNNFVDLAVVELGNGIIAQY